MIVELGVGILAIGTAWYTIHWHRRRKREQAERDRMREEQLEKLKQLKRKFEEEK